VGREVLTRDERAVVEGELAIALAGKADPRLLVPVIFKGDANAILLRTGSSDPLILASAALDNCLRSRWTCDPALLAVLLEYLVTVAGIGSFASLLVRVRQRVDPNRSAYDSSWLLDNSRPFFDRHNLRGHARQLIEGNGRPILRVLADADSFGRSYTGRFFEHLEDCSPDVLHVVTAEVGRGNGPSYRIEDLISDLGDQFQQQSPPPVRAGSSYPTIAARGLLQMMVNDGLWVVVLDGFGQRPLNDEVRETIEVLAARVPSAQYRRRVRLVLLDYPHVLPQVSDADVLSETLPFPADVGQAEVEQCLVGWNALRQARGLPMVEQAGLLDLATTLMGEAPAKGKGRLEVLNHKLADLLGMP
jgi:hypothetical protein